MLRQTTITDSSPPSAPCLIVVSCQLLEALLAHLLWVFGRLTPLLQPALATMVVVSAAWSSYQFGGWSGLLIGVPVGVVVALCYAILVFASVWLLAALLWLPLLALHWLADNCRWSMPLPLQPLPMRLKPLPTMYRWLPGR